MKNLKKIIILSIIMIMAVIYIINNLKDESNYIGEEEIFVEKSEDEVKTNIIVLHVTGEVNIPRDCRN